MIARIIDFLVERSRWAQKLVERNSDLVIALEKESQSCADALAEVIRREQELEIERTRRIAAETIAGERMSEITRLREDLGAVREDLKARMKSLDDLNLKLMEPRQVPSGPDLDEWKSRIEAAAEERATNHAIGNAIRQVRRQSREIDLAILRKQFPERFPQKREPENTQNGVLNDS